MNNIRYYYWRSSGFAAQGLALAVALFAKGFSLLLLALNNTIPKPLLKGAKWLAVTSAECHINAALATYDPKTYE